MIEDRGFLAALLVGEGWGGGDFPGLGFSVRQGAAQAQQKKEG